MTITAATATANIGTTLQIGQSVALAAGNYDSTSFQFALTTADASGTLATDAVVTFGTATTIDLFEDATQLATPSPGQSAAFAGTGTMVNLGTIISDYSNQVGGTLVVSVASFTNDNTMSFAPLALSEDGYFPTTIEHFGHGSQTIDSELQWTQDDAATLDIASASFVNNGGLSVAGGTLDLTGTSFDNTGAVVLDDATGQQIIYSQGIASVANVTLPTMVDVGADTTFNNTGVITADSIVFAGPVTLASLGTLDGALTFDGTLDLGGGTLDAAQYPQVTLGGLIEDGTIGPGVVVLDGATLDNVAIEFGGTVTAIGPITLIDPPASVTAVTLDGTTTELQLSAGATTDISVTAGATSTTDLIRIADTGDVTLAAGFALSDTVAGSTVEIGGFGTLANQGTLTLDAATLLVATTLDGGGTITLENGAAVTLDALAATAMPTIDFGAGAALVSMPGTGALGVTFVGLHSGDVIDFTSVSSVPDGLFGTGGAIQNDGSLDVTGASGVGASLSSTDASDGLTFNVGADESGGTLVVVACFAQGTRIAMAAGEKAVEHVRPGDVARTHGGRLAPVRWVGRTRVDLRRHPAPERAAPIRIRAGAFADGLPRRDLLVSPEHCLLVDGALVPTFLLVNGATVARQDGLEAVTYWHVELDRHDALLAEGLAAESYLDTGNRALFAGEAGVRALHAEPVGPPAAAALQVWAERGCAPLRLEAAAARANLLARARALGWSLTEAPGVRVLADGRALPLTVTGDGVWTRVPSGITLLRVVSDSFVPAEIMPGSGDTRRLGVAVSTIWLGTDALPADALGAGWHAASGEAWRWSDGDATIALPRLAEPKLLAIRFATPGCYWRPPAPATASVLAGSGRRAVPG